MKTRSKVGLIGALAAISVPSIITIVSCNNAKKYEISVNDNRVVLSTYQAIEGQQVNLKLKIGTSEPYHLTKVTAVTVNGRSVAYQFGEIESSTSDWTHYLTIDKDVVIDGTIMITTEVTINQFNISVDEEVDFKANSTQCYHDTTILLGIRSGYDQESIEGIESVRIKGETLDPKYYTFDKYLDNKQYTHFLIITEDKLNPHILCGDISIDLKVQETFCNISCSDNVIISKNKAIKNQSFAVLLKASNPDHVIQSVNEVKIGGNAIEAKYIQLVAAPAAEIPYTHELIISDESLITADIYISMNTEIPPIESFSISLAKEHVKISTDKAYKNQPLDLFIWPEEGYDMSENILITINGGLLVEGYTFEKYTGEGLPDGTYELNIEDEKIIGDIVISIDTWKMYSILSLDEMPTKFDASLSKTALHYGPAKTQSVDVTITRPKDWIFKNHGVIDIIMGKNRIENAAYLTEKDTLGEYTINFNIWEISDDIIFCLGETIQPTKITYEQKIFENGVDITDQGICTIESGTLKDGFWHHDRVDADITASTTRTDLYNFLFNKLEITLVSKKQDVYTLKVNEDYEISIDPSDPKKAHVSIFEGAIDELSSWDARIDKIVFKYIMLDTIKKFSFAVTDGVSTKTYLMPIGKRFTHSFDEDVVDKTKNIDGIEVYRKDGSGGWELLGPSDYVFDSHTNTIVVVNTSITNDIKVQLNSRAEDGVTFENDTWENIAYWANSGDAELLASVYNLDSKNDLLNKERSVTYDGIKQNVKVIGINHDYLKYAEEGDMSGTKGKTAALTFEFSELLKDSSGGVKLDIGENDEKNQNYWRYNSDLTSKGTWGHQSNIRTYLQDVFTKKFDPEVAPWVKTISKRRLANCKIDSMSREPLKATKFMVFNDQYFIANVTELNGTQGKEGSLAKTTSTSNAFAYIREGTVYEAYDDNEGYDYAWKPRAKKLNGSYKEYWTCSYSISCIQSYQAIFDNAEYIYGGSDAYGNAMHQKIGYDMYIAPCFCI